MTFARRRLLLWSALVISILVSIWAVAMPAQESDAPPPLPSPLALVQDERNELRPPGAALPDNGTADAQPGKAAPRATRQSAGTSDDIFAAYSWEPPKTVAAPIKEAPRAPPLPFAFAGHMKTEGPPSYIFSEGTRMHVIAVGETVGEFQLQQASPGALVFLHVPTQLTAMLSITQ